MLDQEYGFGDLAQMVRRNEEVRPAFTKQGHRSPPLLRCYGLWIRFELHLHGVAGGNGSQTAEYHVPLRTVHEACLLLLPAPRPRIVSRTSLSETLKTSVVVWHGRATANGRLIGDYGHVWV